MLEVTLGGLIKSTRECGRFGGSTNYTKYDNNKMETTRFTALKPQGYKGHEEGRLDQATLSRDPRRR